MKDTGLLGAGYNYLNLDDCWGLRDAQTGHIQADPVRFPRGMKNFVDDVHALGFKVGVYTDMGVHGCHHPYTGSWPYYHQDARDFAESFGVRKEDAKFLFGGDQNRNLGLGALDLALVNPSLDMVDSWKFYNKINRARDEIENQMAEEGWGSKYSREYYYKDKDGKIQNKYEDELKRRMPEFQKMGTSFLEGIAAPFEAITAGTLGKLPKGYKVAKAYAGENLGSLGELLTKYGTPTSLGGTAAYGSIPENKEIDKETALRIYKAMMKP